jgi:hypothetical protein
VRADVDALKKAQPTDLSGVREMDEAVVIPRQTAVKVPAPFLAAATLSPAGLS